jgi:hypothetical protein
MANEIIPDEGLDYILAIFPKNGTNIATTYAGMFTSQTATTTPASTAVLATATGVTEAGYTGYLRVSIAAATWGATGAKTIWSQTGRGTTATQVSFPAATAPSAVALNGFFIATTSGTGTGVALMYSNWDDTTAVASLAIGDIVRLTPTFGLLG